MLSNIDQRSRGKEVHYIMDYNLRIMHIHYIRNNTLGYKLNTQYYTTLDFEDVCS